MEMNQNLDVVIGQGQYQVSWTDNHISFGHRELGTLTINTNEVNDKGKYELMYDPDTDQLRQGRYFYSSNEEPVLISKEVFEMDLKNPEVVKEINIQCMKDEQDFVILTDTMKNRLAGNLRLLDIADDVFIVNWNMEEIMLVSDFTNRIDFKNFRAKKETDSGNFIGGLYDRTNKKMLYQNVDELLITPKDTVHIWIKPFDEIDPIGFAQSYNYRDTALLSKIMMVDDPKAVVIALDDMGIKEIIQKNRMANGWRPEEVKERKKTYGKKF